MRSTLMRVWAPALAAFLGVLAAAPVALAQPVVLYGPGLDGKAAAERVRAFLGEGEFTVVGSIDDAIGGTPADILLLGLEPEGCKAPEKSYEPLTSELVAIREALDQMDYGPVLLKARLARKKLPCIAKGATTEDIYDLFFIGGLAAGFEGNEDEARDWFAAAAAVEPSKKYPTQYPPTLRPLYLEGLQKALRSPPANLDRDITDEIHIDGTAWTGPPRLYPGGHLIYITSQPTGLWVDVPSVTDLPDNGIVVTTGAKLRDGLIRGDDRYSPWIRGLAAEKSWSEVLFVGPSSISKFKDGRLIPQSETAEGQAAAREAQEAARQASTGRTIAGLVLVGAGAGIAGAGLGLNMSAYEQGIPKVGAALPARDEYETQYTQNRVGFGLAVGGGVTAAVGLAVTAITLATGSKGADMAAVPWVASDGTTIAFGVGGRLP